MIFFLVLIWCREGAASGWGRVGVAVMARVMGGCWTGGGVEVFSGGAGGSGLGGVALRFAQFGDSFGERGQLRNEHDRGQRPVAGQVGERG